MEVCPLSRGVILPMRRNPYPIHYRPAFACSIIPSPHAHQPPLRLAFPGGGVRGYHVPRAYQSGRGLAITPVVQRLREERSRTPLPDHVPFWFKPRSIFGLSYVTTPVGNSRLLTAPLNPRSRPP